MLNLLFICSFIYCVFNSTASSSEYNSVNGRMIRNYDFEKNMEGSNRDLIWNLAHIWHGEKEENEGHPPVTIISAANEIRDKNIPKLRQKSYWLSELTLLFFILLTAN